MPHTIDEIIDLIDTYFALDRQMKWIRTALDHPGEPQTIVPDPDHVITHIPVYDHPWLRDRLEALILAAATKREQIRIALET